MAELWNKFLVVRRDGSVPEWPWLVMGAADPATPAALRQYALAASAIHGMDPRYCSQIHVLAGRFEDWRAANWNGDPDAPAHRTDDPGIVARIPEFSTKLPPEYASRATYLDRPSRS